jgi:hypothetical protein
VLQGLAHYLTDCRRTQEIPQHEEKSVAEDCLMDSRILEINNSSLPHFHVLQAFELLVSQFQKNSVWPCEMYLNVPTV